MSSNATSKYYCREDDHVAQGKCTLTCPFCGQPMESMGTRWRPGRKGSRTRMWDRRQAGREWVVFSYFGPAHLDYILKQRDKIGRKHRRALREMPGVVRNRWGYRPQPKNTRPKFR